MSARCARRLGAVLLVWATQGAAADIGSASAALAEEVQSAQRALARSESRINRERRDLAQQLNALEGEVSRLRAQNAAARRAADERDLTLSNLRERLAQWQEQSDYQHQLIDSFLGRFPATTDEASPSRLERLRARVDDTAGRVLPHWREEEIVLASGELAPAHTIGIGPASWYLLNNGDQGGLLERGSGAPRALDYPLGDEARADLSQLQRQHAGFITFHPGLDSTALAAGAGETLLSHIQRGGLWALPILGLGLVALAVALGKLWQFRRLASGTDGTLQGELGATADRAAVERARGGASGVVRRLLDITLDTPAGNLRDDLLFTELGRHKHALESWLGALTIIAAVSPLLGLLGTVSGMIETFQLMTLFGAGDPQVVSSGISKALITTELGLVVAIPALLVHTLLSRVSRTRLARVEDVAVAFSRWEGTAA
ncbi:MotA/TolQ/ExbB proton channel family protein [Parahaliea mediterranea]|uniref:MotA/TolQ/ExbB proton channel family protein n=1 Tax=Parahaliea mediterranea TaxID=651086 RepID=UPI000E2EE2AD|nr:MotA/TolQ/ExbB proton channel family protein [Parahaliea mediterranea]